MEEIDKVVGRIREFNRFYTVLIGTLNKNYLQSDYSLTETRILHELFVNKKCTANALAEELQIDKSYMSRILKSFERSGLITKEVSPRDRRSNIIRLTETGLKEIQKMERVTNEQIRGIVDNLNADACCKVCTAMDIIQNNLDKGNPGFVETFSSLSKNSAY